MTSPKNKSLSAVDRIEMLISSVLFTIVMYFVTDRFGNAAFGAAIVFSSLVFLFFCGLIFIAEVTIIKWIKEKTRQRNS